MYMYCVPATASVAQVQFLIADLVIFCTIKTDCTKTFSARLDTDCSHIATAHPPGPGAAPRRGPAQLSAERLATLYSSNDCATACACTAHSRDREGQSWLAYFNLPSSYVLAF